MDKKMKVIGVEPKDSPVITEGKTGPHKIRGIGANFVPKILDRHYIDEVVTTFNEESFEYSRMVGKNEGILVGISSGAAFSVAMREAQKEENKGKNIVVLFPDSGDRYLSTELFELKK
jgi:cysteine synthase A